MKKISLLFTLIVCISCSTAQKTSTNELSRISVEEAGFIQDSLNTMDDFIDGDERQNFRSLVVIKDHKIVIEYAYNYTDRTDIADVRSAGKSFTALLLGIALEDGLVQSLDQDVYSFFSKEKYSNLNEDLKQVKISHLLDMASGLDADSDDWKTPGNAGQWMDREEWTSYILSIPLKRKPGKNWVYADINVALIGAIIEETSGMSLNAYAKEKVFEPLGIHKYYWYTNPSNQTVAAGTIFLSTLDFAKIGVLVANEGKWFDQQIVPADYIEKIIETKTFDISEQSPLWGSYGMLWYKNQATIKGKTVDFLWASGNGGNHLVVVPEEELVIALTSTAYGYNYGQRRSREILNRLFDAVE